jgi:hypothetical protein
MEIECTLVAIVAGCGCDAWWLQQLPNTIEAALKYNREMLLPNIPERLSQSRRTPYTIIHAAKHTLSRDKKPLFFYKNAQSNRAHSLTAPIAPF